LLRFLVESGIAARLADEYEIRLAVWGNAYEERRAFCG
jgi:hypothetical protein